MSCAVGPLEVRGRPLAVADEGSGQAFLWGHGLTSSMAHEDGMRVFSLDLAPAEFRPVRYDARGHGESGDPQEPDAYRWDELARDQMALAGSLRIDTFVTT